MVISTGVKSTWKGLVISTLCQMWKGRSGASPTFAPCAKVCPKHQQICSVCHCTSLKIVLLHLEPVTLPRLIHTLGCEDKA